MFGLDSFFSSLMGNAQLLNLASTAFSIFAGGQKAQQTAAMYDYEAARQAQNAQLAQETAGVKADRLRTAGKRAIAGATAQYAGAGVDISSGSAAQVQGELSRRVELDSLSAMLEGKYQAYQDTLASGMASKAASQARTGGFWEAGKSLLGGLTLGAQISKWGKKADIMTGAVDNWDLAGQH